jgi:hypothetical protein
VATVDERIAVELRAQIDHQIAAADAIDTKAAALAAATFALFTFTLPHVDVSTQARANVAALIVLATLAAIGCFALSLKPRKGAFSYGADAGDMVAERDVDADVFVREFVDGLHIARTSNETTLRNKADTLIYGLWLLVAVGVGLALLLALGGINAGP